MPFIIRPTKSTDFSKIIELCRAVYPESQPWSLEQLQSHLRVFPQGQFVAIEEESGHVVGMAASLVVFWDEYEMGGNWRDFTDVGMFTNHDPEKGRTLYGAEIMVHPGFQGKGIGKMIYSAREKLACSLNLLRIRAGARLRGYGTYAKDMTVDDYVIAVIQGKLFDPTLSFQLKRGFHVLAVVTGYLRQDPESMGFAAVIEWLNPKIATAEDYQKGNQKFRIPGRWPAPSKIKR